jgi:spermidine/putrescine transport system permease protein
MATDVATQDTTRQPSPPATKPRRNLARWLSDHLVLIIGILVLAYMFVPIGYIFALSFNQPSGGATGHQSAPSHFEAFTWHNWSTVCEPEGLCASLRLSVEVSITATVIATILGTLMAFALVRHSFRGRGTSNLLVFLPMATPEVVMGSSLLAMFVSTGFDSVLGYVTIVIAHVLFCLSFVVVTVKARLAGLDARLEQAAMDLYANEWQTFWRITFPLVFPGIMAAALLSFSLSFDDFIVTNFNHGNTITFPMYVWGAAQRGIPPQVNVVGTVMFVVALALVLGGSVLQRRRPV